MMEEEENILIGIGQKYGIFSNLLCSRIHSQDKQSSKFLRSWTVAVIIIIIIGPCSHWEFSIQFTSVELELLQWVLISFHDYFNYKEQKIHIDSNSIYIVK